LTREAVGSFATLVRLYQTARYHILTGRILHSYHCLKRKSHSYIPWDLRFSQKWLQGIWV